MARTTTLGLLWWLLVHFYAPDAILRHPTGQMELFGPFPQREECMRAVEAVRLRRQIQGPITFNCVQIEKAE